MPVAGKKRAPRAGTSELSAVLASQGGPRGIAPTRLVAEPAFLAEVKPLFWKNQAREASQYEKILYNLEENRADHDVEQLVAFRGVGPVPALGKGENAEKVRRVMRTIRYPDVEPLVGLAGVEGMTLPALSTILHFHHPAYPILSKELVRGLNAIGYPVEYRAEITEESLADYSGIMATLDRLKERITFENVPESNCFLTRVLEGALVEAARDVVPQARTSRSSPSAARDVGTQARRSRSSSSAARGGNGANPKPKRAAAKRVAAKPAKRASKPAKRGKPSRR